MKFLKIVFIFVTVLNVLKCATAYDDTRCDIALKQFEEALAQRETWALKFYDTWAKLPSGLLHGNLQNPGHFTECVKFRHEGIQGQHCMVTVTSLISNKTLEAQCDWQEMGSLVYENNLSLIHGFCLPTSCSSEKVITYVDTILSNANMIATNTICRSNDPVEMEKIDYFAFTVLGLLATALLFSTIYDIAMIRLRRKPNELLIAFSVYSNGSKLFAVTENKSPNIINCLNGIKTLSIIWIIFGHRFEDRNRIPVYNYNDSSSFVKNFLYLIYTNHDKAVDSFFVMGGLLTTWSMMNALDKKSVNILRMYLHRYLRYTPSLAVVILFYMSFTKFMGTGPFFGKVTQTCEDNWWSALLHVSVYTNPNTPCYEISWYLAVDFQLFIISPLLIYPLWRWKTKFFWILPVIVLLVLGCIFTTTYNNEITVFLHRMPDVVGRRIWFAKFYLPTHLRLCSWTIGIMLGYVMYNNRGKKVRINKILERTLWILSFGFLLAIILGLYPFQQINNTTSRLANALYNTFFRVMWSSAVAWIIFACQNGSGGAVRWFLSLKQWEPLGKIGLSIYLVHYFYQVVTIINQKQPIYWDFFTQWQKFNGDVLMSLIFGTILYLAVESPVFLIEGYLHKKIKNNKESN